MRCRWNMTRNQVGEWECVDALLERVAFCKEFPSEYVCLFGCTIGAIFDDGFFEGGSSYEVHFEGIECDFGIGDCEEQGARHQGTRGLSN